MGTLTGYHYPTNLFARLADHTYVACGTLGKAWSCWGGSTGGKPLDSGTGSTRRADAIAGGDERGGITCYLINGVCHQAANRILLPGNVTVEGARGYDLSVALFGVYGRPHGLLGFCSAPFHRHQTVIGDLEACVEGPLKSARTDAPQADPRRQAFLERSLALYEESGAKLALRVSPDQILELQLRLFETFVDYKLGDAPGKGRARLSSDTHADLMLVREKTERERMVLESRFADDGSAQAFAAAFDEQTLRFQSEVAKVLDRDDYMALLDQDPDDVVTLADPRIVEDAYRNRPDPAAG